MVDHAEEHTVEMILEHGFWAGLTLYPQTKISAQRAVDIIEKYGPDAQKHHYLPRLAQMRPGDRLRFRRIKRSQNLAGIALDQRAFTRLSPVT